MDGRTTRTASISLRTPWGTLKTIGLSSICSIVHAINRAPLHWTVNRTLHWTVNRTSSLIAAVLEVEGYWSRVSGQRLTQQISVHGSHKLSLAELLLQSGASRYSALALGASILGQVDSCCRMLFELSASHLPYAA